MNDQAEVRVVSVGPLGTPVKVKYICDVVLWRDKVPGNTYHSVRITRTDTGGVVFCPMQYGYGEHYRQTAIQAMAKHGWIEERYNQQPYLFERENDYPVYWTVQAGTKKQCLDNGGRQ